MHQYVKMYSILINIMACVRLTPKVKFPPDRVGLCEIEIRDGRPAPPRTVGRGGFPALTRPVKMIKTAGKLRGKIKAYI